MAVSFVPVRLLLFVLALSNVMTAQRKVDEYTVGAAYQETTWIVPLERFSEPNLAALGTTTLRTDDRKWCVSVMWVVTNEEDRFDPRGPAATDQSYDQWRSEWIGISTRRFPVARLLVINGGGELLIRTSDRRLERSTMGSHDPSVVRIRGKAYRIVNIDVTGPDY